MQSKYASIGRILGIIYLNVVKNIQVKQTRINYPDIIREVKETSSMPKAMFENKNIYQN